MAGLAASAQFVETVFLFGQSGNCIGSSYSLHAPPGPSSLSKPDPILDKAQTRPKIASSIFYQKQKLLVVEFLYGSFFLDKRAKKTKKLSKIIMHKKFFFLPKRKSLSSMIIP